MEIVYRNPIELKVLDKTPIREERYKFTPFVVINENNEIIFGENVNSCSLRDDKGNIQCVLVRSDEIPSRSLAFDMHYLGMTGIIDFENFNSMPKEKTGAPYDLFLWDASQFEANVAKKKYLNPMTTPKDEELF